MHSWARSTAVVVIVLALAAGIAAVASARPASTTLPGFTQVGPVFRQNGFKKFRPTYVRCYTDAEWRRVASSPGVIGFYRGGSWIHVREATCRNGTKALKGEVSYTNTVALSTLLHETLHRQGLRSEGVAECLASWMTGHVVKAETHSVAKAIRALRHARRFAQRLEHQYLTTDDECIRIAQGYGVGNLQDEHDPEPPAYTPKPPPPPAEHLVGYEVSTFPLFTDTYLPYGHTVVRVSYSTVGAYDISVAMLGSNGQTERTFRVEGAGQFELPLPPGYPATRTGPAIVVGALPDVMNSITRARIELRVITR